MIWIIQNLNIALRLNQTTMNFLKSKVFKNDPTSVTWGKLLLIVSGLLAGGVVLTLIVMKVLGSLN